MWNIILKFLLPILVDIAITIGIPAATEWLLKKLPFIPKDVMDRFIAIIIDAISGIKSVKTDEELSKDMKKAQVSAIKRQARRDCVGVACMPETKAL